MRPFRPKRPSAAAIEEGEGAATSSYSTPMTSFTIMQQTSSRMQNDDDRAMASTRADRMRDYIEGEKGTSSLPMPVLQSAMSNSSRRRHKKARIEGGLRVHWERFRKRLGTGTAPSTSEQPDESGTDSSVRAGGRPMVLEDSTDEIDEVVVDREWVVGRDLKTSVTHSEGGENSKEKSGVLVQGTNTDMESFIVNTDGFWAVCTLFIILRWRVWPAIYNFFWVHFDDEKNESHYRKELWFTRKSLALWSAVFFVLTWVIGAAFIPRPLVLMDKIYYFGVVPLLTIPIIFFIMYDLPRDRPLLYQTWLLCATWQWAIYQVLFLYMCGWYTTKDWLFTCGQKDFIGTFYYTTGLPTIALFGLKQDRLPALIGAVVFFILSNSIVVPLHRTWERNLLNFVVFYGFLLYVHYMRESAERRLYTLRDQLKVQFRATQKAQVNESKAADSKRRLTSYVFHEVRVPLNTALLAVQNMEATGAIEKGQDLEFRALEASLTMMSKVLNDVLDFNRLDSGKFESVSKPYAFHQVIRSLLTPIQLATDARKLELVTDFDPYIDEIAVAAMNAAMMERKEATGEDLKDPVTEMMIEQAEGDGIVVGDEMRLRQIITNLASNACKFTPEGGTVSVKTKLILPASPAGLYRPVTPTSNPPAETKSEEVANQCLQPVCPQFVCSEDAPEHALSVAALDEHQKTLPKKLIDWIVVRIEVSDTGYGIPQKEMMASKLFSAFNQTEQGRQQGGKGTGLGLALVRQIVKRSGGRLGVQSKVDEGSTFWVELPLGVGTKILPEPAVSSHENASKVKHFGSEKSTPPIDIEADPVISPARRAMAAMPNITDPSNLAALILATQVENVNVDMSSSSSEGALGDLDGAPSCGLPTSDLPLQQRELNGIDEKHKELAPIPIRPGPIPLAPSREEGSEAPSQLPSGETIKPTPPSNADKPKGQITPGLPVLVVDDDPLTRSLMKRMLTRLGCNVSTAENGEMALKMINGGRPLSMPVPTPMPTPSSEKTASSYEMNGDARRRTSAEEQSRYALVFLDNQMPVLSGVDAVRKLRRFGRGDLVVGVTGNALLSDQQEYLEAGVDHVLTKPVREASLKSMLVLADERRKRTLGTSDLAEEHP